ncbi:MAG: hypothetical protein H0U85_03245, partial [Gemmatimonadales bacterium]|nr:hypothetical protein [Gemmatimonadales bacterium]
GGHTAGERRLLERMAADPSMSDAGPRVMRIVTTVAALAPAAAAGTGAVRARLTGMILFVAP